MGGTGGASAGALPYSLEVILGLMPKECDVWYSGSFGGDWAAWAGGVSCFLLSLEPEVLRSPKASPLFDRNKRELRLELRDSFRVSGAVEAISCTNNSEIRRYTRMELMQVHSPALQLAITIVDVL